MKNTFSIENNKAWSGSREVNSETDQPGRISIRRSRLLQGRLRPHKKPHNEPQIIITIVLKR